MKAQRGNVVTAPLILNLGTNGGRLSASGPGRFTPGARGICGWVGPMAGLVVSEKRDSLAIVKERNPPGSLLTIPTKAPRLCQGSGTQYNDDMIKQGSQCTIS